MNSQLFSKIKLTTKHRLVFVFLAAFLLGSGTIFAQKNEFVVVLDAGHGGYEPGRVGLKNIKEKDITLKIVLQIGKLLGKNEKIKVIYTRKKDVFIGLKERGQVANKADADLFVSIHCNAWHTKSPNGVETYVLGLHVNEQNFAVAKAENEVILLEENYEEKYKGFDPKSPESFIGLTLLQEEYLDQSIQLASLVQKNLVKDVKSRDRGVKQAGFMVLHQTYMPSVLVESGFLTNSKDLQQLNSVSGRTKIANAIYKGITTYMEQLTINSVSSDKIVLETTHTDSPSETVDKNIEFKVQIAAGSRKLETRSYNFKGLRNVERIKVGRSYKYYIGKTSDYTAILEMQKLAKSKGYTTAFIVAFKNGKKIPVESILKKS